LVRAGYLLADDLELVVENATARYDAFASPAPLLAAARSTTAP
jgi:hypothetical protein